MVQNGPFVRTFWLFQYKVLYFLQYHVLFLDHYYMESLLGYIQEHINIAHPFQWVTRSSARPMLHRLNCLNLDLYWWYLQYGVVQIGYTFDIRTVGVRH